MASMSLFDEVMRAEERVRAHVRETPVEPSDVLGALGNCTVHLKCENFQRTGSFKFRGAISKILALSEAERSRGVVTASTGNHGLAVSLAARLLGIPATIYHPVDASKTKLEGIGALGATPVAFGEDCVLCEGEARAHVQREGLAYVSPYNDIQVALSDLYLEPSDISIRLVNRRTKEYVYLIDLITNKFADSNQDEKRFILREFLQELPGRLELIPEEIE